MSLLKYLALPVTFPFRRIRDAFQDIKYQTDIDMERFYVLETLEKERDENPHSSVGSVVNGIWHNLSSLDINAGYDKLPKHLVREIRTLAQSLRDLNIDTGTKTEINNYQEAKAEM